jgi:hypothetical protein
LWIEGCPVVSAADPLRSLISVFYTGTATFFSSSSSFILTRAEWTPFQAHCHAENVVAPGTEPGTSGLAARNCDRNLTKLQYRKEKFSEVVIAGGFFYEIVAQNPRHISPGSCLTDMK